MTLWSTYGPYHRARVQALTAAFGSETLPVSFCARQSTYSFFNELLPNQVVLHDGAFEEIRFVPAVIAAFRLTWKRRPALVLAAGYERPETLGALIACKLRRGKVFLMFDNQADDSLRVGIKEWVKSIYLKFFDAYVYAGPRNAEYLRLLGIPKHNEADGYDCVDNQRFAQSSDLHRRQGLSLHPRPYFLCVARLVAKKNIARLLEAYRGYRLARADSPSWDLVIVGDGPLGDQLKAHATELGIADHVRFVGEVSQLDQVAHWYAFAKAAILPSHESEQWGLVINEAMACGLPVLVSRQCGCSESLVEDRVNGRLFDGKSVPEMAAAIAWLHDQEHAFVAMGRASREIVERFSPKAFATKVRVLYEQSSNRPQTSGLGERA